MKMISKGYRRLFALSSSVSRVNANYCSAATSADVVGTVLDVGQSAISAPIEGKRNMSARVESLLEEIVGLSLLEVSDLNYALKKRLNIPDTPFMPGGMTMPIMSASPATAAADVEEPAPQKISFAVKLTKFDATKKIALIKRIRNLMPGHRRAKKFVESAPVEDKAEVDDAEKFIKKAREYLEKNPPDVIQAGEKIWGAFTFSIKKLMLQCRVRLASHKAMDFFSDIASGCSLNVKIAAKVSKSWKTGLRCHRSFYEPCLEKNELMDAIGDASYYMSTLDAIDLVLLRSELAKVLKERPRGIVITAESGVTRHGNHVYYYNIVVY